MFRAAAEAFRFVKYAQIIGKSEKPPIFCAESAASLEKGQKQGANF
jgi:hypothetical protein